MKIHKEGYGVIRTTALLLIVLVALCAWLFSGIVLWAVSLIAIGFFLFVSAFFRSPSRPEYTDPDIVFSPADGKIVAIEEVQENEYFHERRLQVSVFMSIWNVHINWFPVAGTVEYFRHHHGRFLVAWHPKSSEDNERTTTVVDMGGCKVMFRQIAGLVARRIVSYARVGEPVTQNSQCGFIKFGSRVDIYLPVDADVQVRLGDKVTGSQSCIARLKK